MPKESGKIGASIPPFTDPEPDVEQPYNEQPVSVDFNFYRGIGSRFSCARPKPHEGDHRCKIALLFPDGTELTGDLSWPDLK